MTTETTIMKQIQLAVSKLGWRLFRNNCGRAVTSSGSIIQFGLCVGSSDLIGYVPIVVTPEMVGSRLAIFCAVEVKTPKGRATKEQQAFINAINKVGGIGIIARSVEEVMGGGKCHK